MDHSVKSEKKESHTIINSNAILRSQTRKSRIPFWFPFSLLTLFSICSQSSGLIYSISLACSHAVHDGRRHYVCMTHSLTHSLIHGRWMKSNDMIVHSLTAAKINCNAVQIPAVYWPYNSIKIDGENNVAFTLSLRRHLVGIQMRNTLNSMQTKHIHVQILLNQSRNLHHSFARIHDKNVRTIDFDWLEAHRNVEHASQKGV